VRNDFVPKITHYKILLTIYELNQNHYFPMQEGIISILQGNTDNDTYRFKDYVTYGSLVSYSSKKISRYIMMLSRYNYVRKFYIENNDNMLFKLSDLGEGSLLRYLTKHKIVPSKRQNSKKSYFIELKNL